MTYSPDWEKDIDNLKPDKDGWIHFRPQSLKDYIRSLLHSHNESLKESVAKLNIEFPSRIPEAKHGVLWDMKKQWEENAEKFKRQIISLLTNA